MKRLTVKEMHAQLKAGKAKLRPLQDIESGSKTKKGYNKNYIRDWFDFESRKGSSQ